MYEPAEDSFLLKDVVVDYCSNNKVGNVLDMGSGSGIQAFSVVDKAEFVLAVDISKDSCQHIKEKILEKGISNKMEAICSDLFANVPNRFQGGFDLIMFNPPYLPQEEDDYEESEEGSELYGGARGIHVTKTFLGQAKDYLTENGIIFFVASSFAKLDLLEKYMQENGFSFQVVKEQHISFEDIKVYEAKLLK